MSQVSTTPDYQYLHKNTKLLPCIHSKRKKRNLDLDSVRFRYSSFDHEAPQKLNISPKPKRTGSLKSLLDESPERKPVLNFQVRQLLPQTYERRQFHGCNRIQIDKIQSVCVGTDALMNGISTPALEELNRLDAELEENRVSRRSVFCSAKSLHSHSQEES